MRIQIKLIDGHLYESDDKTREELQTDLDNEWDALKDWEKRQTTKPSLDQYIQDGIENYEKVLQDFTSLNHILLEIEGQNVFFNPRHILWARIIND